MHGTWNPPALGGTYSLIDHLRVWEKDPLLKGHILKCPDAYNAYILLFQPKIEKSQSLQSLPWKSSEL